VNPDGESTSVCDGRISCDGIFLVPKMQACSVAYNHEKREILAFLGEPQRSPPPVSVVGIGDALAVLNLRQDMMIMFAFSHN
jgi:hypothetical protein